MKAPLCVSYWGGRPTADQMLTIAYKSDAAWNETFWNGRTSTGSCWPLASKRTRPFDLQKLISDDGGAVIPMFIDDREAGAAHVRGTGSHPMFDLIG